MVDAELIESLTERERSFRNLLAAGVDLRTSYASAGFSLDPGWRSLARELEQRFRSLQRELVKQQREREKLEQRRLAMIECKEPQVRRAPIQAELRAVLRKIVDADAGAAIGDDGKLDFAALKASGIGPAIRSVGVGNDGKLRSFKLYDKASAAKLLSDIA